MNTKSFLIGFLAVAFAGCSGTSTSRPGPFVKPGLVLVPADQASLYGLKLPPEAEGARASPAPADLAAVDQRAVLTDPSVSVLQFNRYADPARPNELLHEAHIVYRRDAAPRWRLQAPSVSQQILIGPQVTDGRGEIKPLVAPELDSYLREQRLTLRRQEETLAKVTETMRQLGEQQKRFAEQISQLGPAHPEASNLPNGNPPPPKELPPSPKESSASPER